MSRWTGLLHVSIGVLAACLAGVVLLAVGAAAQPPRARAPGAAAVAPSEDSAAVGFARDMVTHHQQAVELSLIARDRAADPAVRQLALDVLTTQATQRGMLLGWLRMWGRSPATSRPAMEWMGMAPPSDAARRAGVLMPGMASYQQVRQLRQAAPRAAERRYLALLIAHHRGGVHMVQGLLAVLGRTEPEQPQLRRLAEQMLAGQQAEIAAMQRMLAALPAAQPRFGGG